MRDQVVFYTDDYFLSSVLCLSGVELLKIEKRGPTKIRFGFLNTDNQATILSMQFYQDKITLPAKSLFRQWQDIRSMAFSVIASNQEREVRKVEVVEAGKEERKL